MKNKMWQSTGNAVFLLNDHFVWSIKYRKPVWIPPIDKRIRDLIQQLCKAAGIEVIRSEVMPNHVHLFVCAKPASHSPGSCQSCAADWYILSSSSLIYDQQRIAGVVAGRALSETLARTFHLVGRQNVELGVALIL
jgi:REP element-mobilizing transposase RayT